MHIAHVTCFTLDTTLFSLCLRSLNIFHSSCFLCHLPLSHNMFDRLAKPDKFGKSRDGSSSGRSGPGRPKRAESVKFVY